MLLDINLPDMSGLDVLEHLRGTCPDTIVIIVTGEEGVDTVVDAMRRGAFDFVSKPFTAERIRVTVRNALEHRRLNRLVEDFGAPYADGYLGMVGNAPVMRAVYRIIECAAPSGAAVFITGESGTGKELCAEAIHRASPRASGPFIAINCAALPSELAESEIFGHVRGAFTGAAGDRAGAAELADGGTLFLDEVCEMPLELQAKLLRFVQTATYRKVGDGQLRNADVRLVSATNRDPRADGGKGLVPGGSLLPPARHPGPHAAAARTRRRRCRHRASPAGAHFFGGGQELRGLHPRRRDAPSRRYLARQRARDGQCHPPRRGHE